MTSWAYSLVPCAHCDEQGYINLTHFWNGEVTHYAPPASVDINGEGKMLNTIRIWIEQWKVRKQVQSLCKDMAVFAVPEFTHLLLTVPASIPPERVMDVARRLDKLTGKPVIITYDGTITPIKSVSVSIAQPVFDALHIPNFKMVRASSSGRGESAKWN